MSSIRYLVTGNLLYITLVKVRASVYFAYICTSFVHLRIVKTNLMLGDGLAAQVKVLLK